MRGVMTAVGGLLLLSMSSYAGFENCGKRIESGRQGVFFLYECDEDQNLVSKKIFEKYKFIEEDFYKPGEKRPFKRKILQSDKISPSTFEFEYLKEEGMLLKSIKLFNNQSDLVGEHNLDLSDEQVLSFSENAIKPPKLMVVDSGFSLLHPSVRKKVFYNSKETLNGLDDDGDGVVDNLISIEGREGYGGSVNYTVNSNEKIQLKTYGVPVSHGTAVADFAMRDIDEFSFMALNGDFHSPVFLYKALELIQKHNILVVNFSFGFGDKKGPTVVAPEAFDAIFGIMMAAPQTLFVIAAGNSGYDFDKVKYTEYPACLRLGNILTVGALNTDKIEQDKLELYKPAKISNRGKRCVDLYAPGENVRAAAIGDSYLKATGTSFAAPYVANAIMKIHRRAPDLSAREIKSLILDTVYKPRENKLPSRSEGFVDLQAAYEKLN